MGLQLVFDDQGNGTWVDDGQSDPTQTSDPYGAGYGDPSQNQDPYPNPNTGLGGDKNPNDPNAGNNEPMPGDPAPYQSGGNGGDKGGSAMSPGTPTTDKGALSKIADQLGLTKNGNLDWGKIIGLLAGGATMYNGLQNQNRQVKSVSQLVGGLPSNTPTLTPAQIATAQQPMLAGNQLKTISAANMPSPIVQGKRYAAGGPVNNDLPAWYQSYMNSVGSSGGSGSQPWMQPSITPDSMNYAGGSSTFNEALPGNGFDMNAGLSPIQQQPQQLNIPQTPSFTANYMDAAMKAAQDAGYQPPSDPGATPMPDIAAPAGPVAGVSPAALANLANLSQQAGANPGTPTQTNTSAAQLTADQAKTKGADLGVQMPDILRSSQGMQANPNPNPTQLVPGSSPDGVAYAGGSATFNEDANSKPFIPSGSMQGSTNGQGVLPGAAVDPSMAMKAPNLNIPSQMQSDWDNYWSTPDGQSQKWGGGTIQHQGNNAVYTDGSGKQTTFDKNADMLSLANQNQGIANQWNSQYGTHFGQPSATVEPPPTSGQTQWSQYGAPNTGAKQTPWGYAFGGKVQGPLTQASDDDMTQADDPSEAADPGALTQSVMVGLVPGVAGGQDDTVDAKLSPGEYVWDAETVSMLGDGNNAAGADKLDQAREAIRAQKRSAPQSDIPTKAKGPLSYIQG